MKRITIHQYEPCEINSIDDLEADDIFEDLLRIQMKITSENNGIQPFILSRTLQSGKIQIKAIKFVGLLSGSRIILEILPKKSLGEITLSNVIYMSLIGKTGEGFGEGFGPLLLSHASASSTESLASEHLYSIPFIELVSDLINGGYLESDYAIEEEVSRGRIRGRLNLERNATSIDPSEFEVDMVASVYDTGANRTIKYTLKKLLEKQLVSGDVLTQCKLLLEELEEVSNASSNSLIFQRESDYPSDIYDHILGMAGIILHRIDPDSTDSSVSPPNFLMDLDLVFERHVCVGLRDLHEYFVEHEELGVNYQPTFSAGLRRLAASGFKEIDKKMSFIEPDAVVHSGKELTRVVLDAKNKFTQTSDGLGVSNPDLYQIYYYAKRLGLRHCILVYPQSKSTKTVEKFLMFDRKIMFTKYTLPITGAPSDILMGLRELGRYCYHSQLESSIISILGISEDVLPTDTDINEAFEELGITGKDAQNPSRKLLNNRLSMMGNNGVGDSIL